MDGYLNLKWKELALIVIMLTCILTLPIINVNAVAFWYALDEKNDVIYWFDGEYQDTGDYIDAIDIVSVSIDGKNIIMKFAEEPIYANYYCYSLSINWDYNVSAGSDPVCYNRTSALFSGLGDWNSITTYIALKNGTLIYMLTIYEEIVIEQKSIIFPIPGLEYIVDKVPEDFSAVAGHRSNSTIIVGDYFYDVANGTIVSGHLSGFSAIAGIVSLFTILLLFGYRKKK